MNSPQMATPVASTIHIEQQKLPTMEIQCLPGGYIVTTTDHGNFPSPIHRDVVPNLDALVSTLQRWAAQYHAESK